MSREPLRTILLGYTLAGSVAAALGAAGLGLVPALLVVWLGGAVATVGVAAVAFRGRSAESLAESGVAGADLLSDRLVADLRRWDEDAAADSAPTEQRRAGGDSLP